MSEERMPPMSPHATPVRAAPRTQRGSVLVASYCVILVLTLISIPQTLRSLSSVQLERRFVSHRSIWHTAEAGLDEAARTLWSQPFFGNTGPTTATTDDDTGGTVYEGAGGSGVSTAGANFGSGNPNNSPCPAAPATWTGQWDCLRGGIGLPGYAAGTAAYLMYVQDIIGPGGKTVIAGDGQLERKRVRIIARHPQSAENASDLVFEAVMAVVRKWEATGLHVGQHLAVATGNGIEDVIVHGQEIRVYGQVAGNAVADAAIRVGGSQAIWGKVYVNQTPGSGLCCNGIINPPDAVSLSNSGFDLNARIRQYDPNDTFFEPGTGIDGDQSYAAKSDDPAWNAIIARDPFTTTDGTQADEVGYSVDASGYGNGFTADPTMASHLPEFMPGNPQFQFEPVTMATSDPGCAAREVHAPGSGRVTTFCMVGDNQGACAGSETDTNPVYHIGQAASAGAEPTVEYCVKSINAGEGSYVRFQGDNIRVYASGYEGSTPPRAFQFRANSHVYSFKTSETTNASAAFTDDTKSGKLSFRVLDNNTYTNGQGVVIAPQIDVSSDEFFGSVYAPRSEVNFQVIVADDRGTGIVVARKFTHGGSQGRGYLRIRPQVGSERNRTVRVDFIAWRRCLNTACTQ